MRKLLVLIAASALAAVMAPAQDWAKARLEKSPRHQEWVKVKHGSREVNCFIVYPEVKDKATAVLVIHEIFGLSEWVRGVADQLAEAGYIAIARLATATSRSGAFVGEAARRSALPQTTKTSKPPSSSTAPARTRKKTSPALTGRSMVFMAATTRASTRPFPNRLS